MLKNFKIKVFHKYNPRDLKELQEIVFKKISKFDFEFNDINVSHIDNLNKVFSFLDIKNTIKNQEAINKFYQQEILMLDEWDVSNLKDFSNFFLGFKNFNTDLSSWDVSNGVNFHGMFSNCFNFNQDVSCFDFQNAENLNYMFSNCEKFNHNCYFNFTYRLKILVHTFSLCRSLNVSFYDWDTSNFEYLEGVFYGTSKLVQNFKKWDLKNLKDSKNNFKFSRMENFLEFIPKRILELEYNLN